MEPNFSQTGAFKISTKTRSPHVEFFSNVSIEVSHVLVIKETTIHNPFAVVDSMYCSFQVTLYW